MIINDYFFLNRECFLVKGAKNAAIYNLESGNIYSIDLSIAKIIDLCESKKIELDKLTKRVNVNDIILYFKELERIGLGKFYDKNFFLEKYAPPYSKEFTEINKRIVSLNKKWFEITKNCNLNCLHCYENDGTIAKCSCSSTNEKSSIFNTLPLDIWEKIISELDVIGCKSIHFIGGEPLLLSDLIFNIMERAYNIGIREFLLTSNVTLLNEEIIEKLKHYNVKVIIPFYSKRDYIFNNITQSENSFSKVKNYLLKLLNQKINIEIELQILKQNLNVIDETVAYLNNLGIKNIRFMLIKNKLLMESNGLNSLFIKEGTFQKINKHRFFMAKEYNLCFYKQLAITSQGDIIPCIMAKNYKLGNVKKDSLINVLKDSNIIEYWELNKDKVKKCSSCEYRYGCIDCRIVDTKGDLFGANKFCLYDPLTGRWLKKPRWEPNVE